MAKRKRAKANAGKDAGERKVDAGSKIAGLLAIIATKEMDKDDAALKLDAIGFDAREISALLDVGPNYVNVAKHRKKKPRGKN